jgi:preprotein translocase subunit SecE
MRKIIKFLSEVKAEFKNISWPSRESLIRLTFVVISISIFISLILGGFDYLFTQGIALLGQQQIKKPSEIAPIISIAPLPSTAQEATPSIKLINK